MTAKFQLGQWVWIESSRSMYNGCPAIVDGYVRHVGCSAACRLRVYYRMSQDSNVFHSNMTQISDLCLAPAVKADVRLLLGSLLQQFSSLANHVVDIGDAFPSIAPAGRKTRRIKRKDKASQSSAEETVALNGDLESNVHECIPHFNDWAIVNNPKSKFHGHPCQMKNMIDSETRRANIYVYADGEYHVHDGNHVKYKQCRLMTEQEIELLRSKLGEFLLAFNYCFDSIYIISSLSR
jgi:hypothetical protein